MPNANLDMPLGEMIKVLVATLHKKNVPLPFKNQKPWHLLFYSLKKQPAGPGKPPFLDELVFDWDGPYPKCEELTDYLNALHETANVSAFNPSFDFISVDDADATRWSRNLRRFRLAFADVREASGKTCQQTVSIRRRIMLRTAE